MFQHTDRFPCSEGGEPGWRRKEQGRGRGARRRGRDREEERRGGRVREGSCDAREAEEEGEKTPHQYSKCHVMCNMVCMSPVRMA